MERGTGFRQSARVATPAPSSPKTTEGALREESAPEVTSVHDAQAAPVSLRGALPDVESTAGSLCVAESESSMFWISSAGLST